MNAITAGKASEIIEAVIAKGDLSALSAAERAKFYVRVCESVGLNPMTRPFEYIVLNGKLTLYARKDCTDQLRSIYEVSITDLTTAEHDGVFIATAKVRDKHGRTDVSTGAVNVASLKGEFLANAMMKAETKAKRRATLSICGLGFLDETELPARSAAPSAPPEPRPRLVEQLDALSAPTETSPPQRKRGRKAAEPEQQIDIEETITTPPSAAPEWPDDTDVEQAAGDFQRGTIAARAGQLTCLNKEISSNPKRLAAWQRGYDSAKAT